MMARCLPSREVRAAIPSGDPLGFSGYGSGGFSVIIDEPDRGQSLGQDLLLNRPIREVGPAFAMGHPDAQPWLPPCP